MSDNNEINPDPRVEETERALSRSAAARLFDIRRVIGGLFALYGVIVTLIGIFDGQSEIAKAQGVRINLWAGLTMLVFGLLMLAWGFIRPVQAPPEHRNVPDDDAGRP